MPADVPPPHGPVHHPSSSRARRSSRTTKQACAREHAHMCGRTCGWKANQPLLLLLLPMTYKTVFVVREPGELSKRKSLCISTPLFLQHDVHQMGCAQVDVFCGHMANAQVRMSIRARVHCVCVCVRVCVCVYTVCVCTLCVVWRRASTPEGCRYCRAVSALVRYAFARSYSSCSIARQPRLKRVVAQPLSCPRSL